MAPALIWRVLYRTLISFELRFPSHVQKLPKVLYGKKSIFEVLKTEDVLLHHPFHSFAPVIKLLKEAARDPHVLAIKQTLYRSGVDSEIVQVLAEAARNGGRSHSSD